MSSSSASYLRPSSSPCLDDRKDKSYTHKSVRFDNDLLREVLDRARKEDRKFSNFVRCVLKKYLEEKG